jgi:hypothetical protein
MAATELLRTHLVDELADLRDAETQLTKLLPKMAEASFRMPGVGPAQTRRSSSGSRRQRVGAKNR